MERVVTLLFPVFLLLLHSRAAKSHVEPPTNLTLHCRNLQNILKWAYDNPPPGLKYKVVIRCNSGDPHTRWVDPPALQADLSFLSETDLEYYVTVTAVLGGNQSAPSKGIEFSYFQDALIGQKCVVDLPSVDVIAQKDDTIRLSFEHPWLFHKTNQANHLKSESRKRRSHDPQVTKDLPEFKYEVVILNQKEQPHSFSCVESVCEEELYVDAAQEKHCLKITGEMEKMSVEATQDYCASPLEKTQTDYYIYIIVASLLLVAALIFIGFMVYKKKTAASSSFPQTMNIPGTRKQWTLGVDQEQVLVPVMEPQSPDLLLPTTDVITDVTEITPALDSEQDCRMRIGVSAEDEDEEAPNVDNVEYVQGRNLDESETPDTFPSAYERRPVFVEMGSGEIMQGYRGVENETGLPQAVLHS
ncbi:interferon gamma receptor 1-like precursor [Xyrichtys novacula]|uniref:Interferon gamma receptor 1-like n=1 Tax=Xyrichtys novacula TaxID=13765 RepID=A0AAV1FZR7_XYRNO|nr:interferon gamma receptor 1-like precursor [Xyrichtys novacula]